MTTSAMSCLANLDPDAKQVAAVTYKLKGEKIKAALLMNPGKVIISQRQSGKTTSLAEYIFEHYPDGVIVFYSHELSARQLKLAWPTAFFDKCTIAWGNVYPPMQGLHQPIFADEICGLGGTMQKQIVKHPDFMGAVSSATDFTEPEVRKLCILS
jgi:hypothetical protein